MNDVIEELAPQIDRLVWSVNDLTSPAWSDGISPTVERVGPILRRTVSHFAAFWLSGPLQLALAEHRFIYDPPGAIRAQFQSLADDGLLDETAEGWVAAPGFVPTLREVASARAAASTDLWGDDVAEATRLVEKVTSEIEPDHPVAYLHASLDVPVSPALRLFNRLTTLRYVRQHDHIEAWSAAGLNASEIKALTLLAAGGGADVPPTLIERGLVDGDSLTSDGKDLRSTIEAETNRRNDASWRGLDEVGRRELLGILSGMRGDAQR